MGILILFLSKNIINEMKSTLRNVYWTLFVVLCLVGCISNTSTVEEECTELIISEIKDSVCFSDVIEEYQYIPLSNRDGYTIGEISQVLISEGKIYILSDGVFCYDMKGNPLFRINEKGGEKSEILKGTSISIEDGILYLYDERKRVIHKYNSKNGKFIENVSLSESIKGIYKIKDCFVAETFSCTSEFYEGIARFLVYDNCNFSNGPQKIYLSDDLYNFPIYGQVTFNNANVLFSDYFNNKVYKIDNDSCSLSYHINFNGFSALPSNVINDMVEQRNLIAEDNDYQYGLVDMYENQDFFVGDIQGGIRCKVIYNKNSNNSVAFKRLYSSSRYQMAPHKFVGTNNGYFIHAIPAETIIMYKKIFGFGDILPSDNPDSEKQRILMNCNADDNPIIALYKFKKF